MPEFDTVSLPEECGCCECNGSEQGDTPECCASRGCCPGEDGHYCGQYDDGDGCCCCGVNEAPAGPDCDCVYVG